MEVQIRSRPALAMIEYGEDDRFHVETGQRSNHDKDSVSKLSKNHQRITQVPKPTILSSVLHSGNDFLNELHSKLNAALTLVSDEDDDDDDDDYDKDIDSADDDVPTGKAKESIGSVERLPVAHQGSDSKMRRCRPTVGRSTSSSSSWKTPHRLSLTSNHGSMHRAGPSGQHHRSASDTGFVSSAGSVSETETPATGSVSRISQESSSCSLAQSVSEGSLSWASNLSCDSQIDDSSSSAADQSMQFMKNFVDKLFKNNISITLEEKARFGVFCQTEMGRLWFSRYVNTQRVHNKNVDESTFYSLVQYFAIVLFECSEADDYTPAKTLMNMCFTYYHEMFVPHRGRCKEFLYLYLREQLIWQSLRFWNAAFFDAVQCERTHRPVATRQDVEQYSPEEMSDEQVFQENITFGQLGSFTCNMHAFGLSRELCLEFLRKQSTIANLRRDQDQMLRDNIERMYRCR